MGSRYAWIIDVDHDATEGAPEGTNDNAKGRIGPRNVDPALLAVLERGEGRTFRMYGDEDELVYEGRWVGPHWREYDGRLLDETAFGPLWDFGAPNWGCTDIFYRANGDNTGDWKQL